jgi:hypothetical protein
MTGSVQFGEIMCRRVKGSECFQFLTEHRGTKHQKFNIQTNRTITITTSLPGTPNIYIECTLINI